LKVESVFELKVESECKAGGIIRQKKRSGLYCIPEGMPRSVEQCIVRYIAFRQDCILRRTCSPVLQCIFLPSNASRRDAMAPSFFLWICHCEELYLAGR
jgi:hypothetical protein